MLVKASKMPTIEVRWRLFFFNFSDKHVSIDEGDRFTQIIFQKIVTHITLSEVLDYEETVRGILGFGVTNLKC